MKNAVQYQLVRAKRKTVSVCVKDDGTVEVRAPGWVSNARIRRFVEEKSDWIIQKKMEIEQRNRAAGIRYTEGAVFTCLGTEYKLHIEESGKNAVLLQDDLLIIKTRAADEASIKGQMIKWCGEQLACYIRLKAEEYLPLLSETAVWKQEKQTVITGITIRNMKSRWGSCSAKGRLSFNVKLVLAPPKITDYVIIHELCHLQYMNHKKEFWDMVGQLQPDYQERRKYLRENGWQYEF